MMWTILIVCIVVYLLIGVALNIMLWVQDDFLGRYTVAVGGLAILLLWGFYPLIIVYEAFRKRLW